MIQERYDGIIIGAGAAGMSSAHYLRDLNIMVLEEEGFFGGRTRSEDWGDGIWLNLGAQFHEATSDWAREVGVTMHSGPPPPPAVYWRGRMVVQRSRFMYFIRLPLPTRAKLSLIWTYFRLLPDLRRYPAVRPELEGKSLLDVLGHVHPQAKQFFDLWAPSAGARDISELPVERGLSTMQLAFGSLVRRGVRLGIVEGGTSALFSPVTKELGSRLVLQANVTRVVNTPDGVQVTYLRGDDEVTVAANVCICTTPTASALRIMPGISQKRRATLERITFVPLVTIALRMEPRSAAPWDEFYWLKVDGKYISNVLNYAYFLPPARRPKGASLSILATGDPAERLLTLSDEGIQDSVSEEFYSLFPTRRGTITDVRIARWPQALHFVPLSLQSELEDLYDPDGSIYLAGEYLEGGGVLNAIQSGRRAADSVRKKLDAS